MTQAGGQCSVRGFFAPVSGGGPVSPPFARFYTCLEKGTMDMNSDTLDLTRGSVPLCLIRFSFPLLLANLLQSFYSMADLLVVGRFVGETGLAAVSSASTLCFLLNAVCMGFSAGGTAPHRPGPGRRGPPWKRRRPPPRCSCWRWRAPPC